MPTDPRTPLTYKAAGLDLDVAKNTVAGGTDPRREGVALGY